MLKTLLITASLAFAANVFADAPPAPVYLLCAAQGHPFPGAVAHVFGKTTLDQQECCDTAVTACEAAGWADCACAEVIPGAPAPAATP